jgi:excisionase family DNA binding protein
MLTVPEAARRVGRNPETVRRWIRERKLVAAKVGHQHVIDEDDLSAFMAGPVRGGPATLTASYAPTTPSSVANEWLPAVVGRIVRLVDPVRIVLFGSRGSGSPGSDSDYDLLVVLDEAPDRRATEIAILGAIADLPISKDVVLATPEEVGSAPSLIGDILRAAVLSGRTVYERSGPR